MLRKLLFAGPSTREENATKDDTRKQQKGATEYLAEF